MAKPKQSVEDETPQADGQPRLTNVLALLLVKDVKSQVDQIDMLGRAGFKSSEIASLLGTTRNTVSVALSNLKKQKKKK